MKRTPNLWKLRGLYVDKGPQVRAVVGSFVSACQMEPLLWRNRIKLAWGVFMGRYDAVKWPNPCR